VVAAAWLCLRPKRCAFTTEAAFTLAATATITAAFTTLPLRHFTWFGKVAHLDGIHRAAPWEKGTVNVSISTLSAHDVNCFMACVQKACFGNCVQEHGCILILGRQVLQGLAKLHRQRADAAMPLLLGIATSLLNKATIIRATAAANTTRLATDIGEANRIRVQKSAATPASVLYHLPRLLVVELRNNRCTKRCRHVKTDLVHASLSNLAGAQREVINTAILLSFVVVGENLYMCPSSFSRLV